jgi:hypothetical protein
MSVPYYGDYLEYSTIYIPVNTFDSNDPSQSVTATDWANTDVHIHKLDDLTQRNNAAGVTVSIDFDGITGCHLVKIDASDTTVDGFFERKKDYLVRIEGVTVDVGTINPWIAIFSIENRYWGRSHERMSVNVEEFAEQNVQIDPDTGFPYVTMKDWKSGERLDIELAKIGTIPSLDGGDQTIGAAIAKLADDNGGATFNAGEDSLNKIRDDRTLPAADYVVVGDTLARVTLVDTVTTNTDLVSAADVWDATVNEATAGAAPTTAKGKLQSIWNRLNTKRTATAELETAYESDDVTTMETWVLADDDTTASRTR